MSADGSIGNKIALLRGLGFPDPVEIAKKNRAIISSPIDKILKKIAEMRELGFSEPVQMIASNPKILSYSIGNIRTKITNLRELGFADPVKIITCRPPIAGLAIDNVRNKIASLRQLGFVEASPDSIELASFTVRAAEQANHRHRWLLRARHDRPRRRRPAEQQMNSRRCTARCLPCLRPKG